MHDTLKISKNDDGSFTMDWDKEDSNWSWMNNLTSTEIQVIIQQTIQNGNGKND
jgi:hypothetical protein